MPKFILGRVVGPKGDQGPQGVRGLQGIQGDQGVPGNDGVTPSLQVGTVTTLPAGSTAAVRRREGSSDAAPVFDFDIPRGDKGDTGNFSGNCFYRTFEAWDWTSAGGGAELRILPEEHQARPTRESCFGKLRMRTGRNAMDVRLDTEAAAVRTAIIAAQTAGLAANTATAGTYPTAADGHIVLDWNQVQYYILDNVLVSAELAAQAAAAKGFAGWADRPVEGAEVTATLEQVLAAAYLPAMGTPATAFDALCTVDVLRGLRLRRRADGVTGTVGKYDLDGILNEHTWAVMESAVTWDLETSDLVIASSIAFAGDIMVMG